MLFLDVFMKVDRKQIEAHICVASLSVVHKRKLFLKKGIY
jgi:hypothetical protein